MPTDRDAAVGRPGRRGRLGHPKLEVDEKLTRAVEDLVRRDDLLGLEVVRAPQRPELDKPWQPSGKPDGPGRPEKPWKPDKPWKPGRPDEPGKPTKPGRPDKPAPADTDLEVDLNGDQLTALFRNAGPKTVVWSGTAGELQVVLARTRVGVRPGVLLVALTVSTEETDDQEMVVPLLVGTEQQNLGLDLAAQKHVVGHSAVAALWSEALTAHAWSTLLAIAETSVAAATQKLGRDVSAVRSKPGAVFTRGEDVLVVRSRTGITTADVFGREKP